MAANVRAVSLVDAVAEALRIAVISGDIPAGGVITEHGVATRFDVARSTAKAAVERLVTDGFLQRSAHKSARAPVLTTEDITDLYDTRTVLEESALSRLAATRQIPPAAERAADELVRHAERDAHDSMAAADVSFHRALVEAAGSPRLARMHSMIMGEAHICMVQVQDWRLLQPQTIIEEHERILDAIRSGDPDTAAAEVRSHLARARDQLLHRHDALTDVTGPS